MKYILPASFANAESLKEPKKLTAEDCVNRGLSTDFVDFYAISDADELYWFANEVNSVNNSINAILTENITVNADINNSTGRRAWTPMVGTGYWERYNGTFEGNPTPNHIKPSVLSKNTAKKGCCTNIHKIRAAALFCL